jgi:hypothetical protein
MRPSKSEQEKKSTATRAVLGGEGWKLHPPKRDWQQPAHGGPRFFGGRARGLLRLSCGSGGAPHTMALTKLVRYFAVGGLALRLLVGSGGMA